MIVSFLFKSQKVKDFLLELWVNQDDKIATIDRKNIFKLTLLWMESIFEKNGKFSITKFGSIMLVVNILFIIGFMQATDYGVKSILLEEEQCMEENQKDYENCLSNPSKYHIAEHYDRMCVFYDNGGVGLCSDEKGLWGDTDLEKICKGASQYSWTCASNYNGKRIDDLWFIFFTGSLFIWGSIIFDAISYFITRSFYRAALAHHRWGWWILMIDVLVLISILYVLPIVLLSTMGHAGPRDLTNENYIFMFLFPFGPLVELMDSETIYQKILMLPAALSISLSSTLILLTYVIVKMRPALRFINYLIERIDQIDAQKYHKLIYDLFFWVTALSSPIAFIMYLRDKGL